MNGLGWSVEQTSHKIQQLLAQFPLLEETPQIFTNWLEVVTTAQVMGKRTHDARLLAIMLANGVTHLLTLNPSDFNSAANITIVHPQELI